MSRTGLQMASKLLPVRSKRANQIQAIVFDTSTTLPRDHNPEELKDLSGISRRYCPIMKPVIGHVLRQSERRHSSPAQGRDSSVQYFYGMAQFNPTFVLQPSYKRWTWSVVV
jgi:hypothetical protein